MFTLLIGLYILTQPLFALLSSAQSNSNDLQQIIDLAELDSTITLPSGTYNGPVVIDKKLTIQTNGIVRIVGTGDEPTLRIMADGVRLSGLYVEAQSTNKDAAAIVITANDTLLEQMHIESMSYGIRMKGANRSEIRDSVIIRNDEAVDKPGKLSDRRNGIDLFDSHDSRLTGNRISHMLDGIYVERSNNTFLENNEVSHSRYGIHCMFTEGTIIRNNNSTANITGAMIMDVQNVEVTGNDFAKQSESVNSQGMLLYKVQSSLFANNRVAGNRVGIFFEQSHNNELSGHDINGNFIGLQLVDSENNRIQGNQFIGNVVDAQARGSSNNELEGNYFDSFRGIDVNGDGASEIPYAINPFFYTIIHSTPAYQILFQSPGMMFLESLFQVERDVWTTDPSPLTKPLARVNDGAAGSFGVAMSLISFILLATAVYTMINMGVRRS